MRQTINLPLYDNFIEILINHEIKNWKAKDFCEKMCIDKNSGYEQHRRLVYVGLKVLVKCNYLRVDLSESNSRKFSYSETNRTNFLRERYRRQILEKIFMRKKIEFLNQIKDKENNINFIKTLLADDKTLEKYFIEHQNQLENDIRNINLNIKFMEDFLN
ncbi:hypothetical protein [Acinetobacter soli]|uniref:hypothetical protein n=1 Tax=Acinetobacter soli TaxID=487316 RepID=UPI000DCFFB9A|nr:hypothetical protein [Acinetobacter soli]